MHLSEPLKKKVSQDKKGNAITDELSTLPDGMEVLVRRNGEVEVLDSKSSRFFFSSKIVKRSIFDLAKRPMSDN